MNNGDKESLTFKGKETAEGKQLNRQTYIENEKDPFMGKKCTYCDACRDGQKEGKKDE